MEIHYVTFNKKWGDSLHEALTNGANQWDTLAVFSMGASRNHAQQILGLIQQVLISNLGFLFEFSEKDNPNLEEIVQSKNRIINFLTV